MSDKDAKAEILPDDALDQATGGGRVPAHTPEFTNPVAGDPGRTQRSHELTHIVQQTKVWKAPAGQE